MRQTRDYVLARDHCRGPGCTTRSPKRLQMDHAIPFPEGETSAANCGGACNRHHPLKTAGYVDILDSKADGSTTFLTAWGQKITIPPRPFLHDPADHPTNDPDEPEAPPGQSSSPPAPPSCAPTPGPDQPGDPPF